MINYSQSIHLDEKRENAHNGKSNKSQKSSSPHNWLFNCYNKNGILWEFYNVVLSRWKSSYSYHKNPNETTEWEDILAERGIVPRKQVII